MSKLLNIIKGAKNKRYILQQIYTLEYVTKTQTGFFQRAEYTFTANKMDATQFDNHDATMIIAATAQDNGIDNEKEFQILEILKAIEI